MKAGAETGPPSRRRFANPVAVFAAVATLLLGLGWLVYALRPPVVTVVRADLDRWILEAERSAGEPLDSTERATVEQAFVDRMILASEARALGLDDDEATDDLLAQRMLDALGGDAIGPTDAELQAYFREHGTSYTTEPRMAVEEVVVSPRYSQEALPAPLADGEDPAALLGGPLVSYRPMTATEADLSLIFDAPFAERVAAAPVGEWVGPHTSPRGAQWVRVSERDEGRIPPLEDVVETVRIDWIAEQEEARLAARMAELRARYQIDIVSGGTSGS